MRIVERLVGRVGAVSIHVEPYGVADGRADFADAGKVALEALPALILSDAEAMTRDHPLGFLRHRCGRLSRYRPGQFDIRPSMPILPQRTTALRRVEVPAGIIDQRLRCLVLRDCLEPRAYLMPGRSNPTSQATE